MSQTSKTLKNIASGEEYKTLVKAIQESDYETLCSSYLQVSKLIAEAEKTIRQKIQSLPRGNKDEEYQSFKSAFASRAKTTLPQWHWINLALEKQKVMKGETFGVGSKGHPLARTPEGRVVVINGATLEPGEVITFQLTTEGNKVDFGRIFELNPDSLYFILNQDARQSIRNSLASIKERINNHSGDMDKNNLSELGDLLRELDNLKSLVAKLKADEQKKIMGSITAYRRRLLKAPVIKLAFEFFSKQEEGEIKECCQGDARQIDKAMSAPGLFRQQQYKALKAELFSGEKLRGYSELIGKLERNLDSMDSALEFLDFKVGIEKIYPKAKRYVMKMDRLFDELSERAKQLAFRVVEDKSCEVEEINSIIKEAFSSEVLYSELRDAFRTQEEFFSLRRALADVRTRLGNTECLASEAALKPYLSRKLDAAFSSR